MGSGDFSHDPLHVFWTCLGQIVKSKNMPLQKIPVFWIGENENGRVAINKSKIHKMKIQIKRQFLKAHHILDVYV